MVPCWARGPAVTTSLSHSEDRRFESGRAHPTTILPFSAPSSLRRPVPATTRTSNGSIGTDPVKHALQPSATPTGKVSLSTRFYPLNYPIGASGTLPAGMGSIRIGLAAKASGSIVVYATYQASSAS